MTRIFLAATTGFLLAACGGEPAKPAEPTAPEPVAETPATPDPTALPTPALEQRVGTMNLLCGGATFRVAFLDTLATVVNDDGTNTELQKQPAGPDSEPGVDVYTDGKMSFAKSGGGDTPTVIRFARGRMAWQDCAIAQN